MALNQEDLAVLEQIETKGPGSEFGAAGKLSAMARFGEPSVGERQRISVLLAKMVGAPGA